GDAAACRRGDPGRAREHEVATLSVEARQPAEPANTGEREQAKQRVGITLSFLGLGFPPDIPTWGRILYDAKDNLDHAPHWAIFPGTAIFLTVLSINYIGDGLRDALDPRRVLTR